VSKRSANPRQRIVFEFVEQAFAAERGFECDLRGADVYLADLGGL
jgi:hypothetical protein